MYFKLHILLGGLLGCFLAYCGYNILTWQYWVIGIAYAIAFCLGQLDTEEIEMKNN